MAMPQNLNFPRIITVGVVGVLLLATTVVGTQAVYNFYTTRETARKYELIRHRDVDLERDAQTADLLRPADYEPKTRDVAHMNINDAIAMVVKAKGKLPNAPQAATTTPTTTTATPATTSPATTAPAAAAPAAAAPGAMVPAATAPAATTVPPGASEPASPTLQTER